LHSKHNTATTTPNLGPHRVQAVPTKLGKEGNLVSLKKPHPLTIAKDMASFIFTAANPLRRHYPDQVQRV